MKDYSVYYIRALNEAQTKQNISVFENQTGNVNYLRNHILGKDNVRKNKNAKLAFELNQMESLILAQDERWRHA